jgi:protein MpaA
MPAAYEALASAWKSLRGTNGVSVREVACVGAPRTLLAAEIAGPPGALAITLSAGVHGDEPAGAWALYSIVRDGLLDRTCSYRLWPCTNPSGYERHTRENAEGNDINRSFNRGGRTPEARAIVTANRDRTYALAIDLHEDFEANGFYCYEPVIDGTAPLGAAIVGALDENGLPVQVLDDDFDLGYPPEARHLRTLERGRALPNPDSERAFFEGTPYSLYILKRAAKRALTLETPRMRPWEERIAMHRVAVVTAIDRLLALARAASPSR